jgi:hypothetical protein
MNSGLQDAYNLAWKLALVSKGVCGSELVDSYDAERRPVAESIAASGEASERMQQFTDAASRRERDEALQAMFADPFARHHEVVAEAELDIDYGDSPIVIGEGHPDLSPGQRLPDTFDVALAGHASRGLHALTHRAGHTALLIGGPEVRGDDLAVFADAVSAQGDSAIIEATFVLKTEADVAESSAGLTLEDTNRLGIREVTLLVVRPDGYIGLRADRNHLDALKAYQSLLIEGSS